jgi:hypothetical protein
MQRNVLGAAALVCLLGGCGGVTQVPQFGGTPGPTQAPTATPTSSPAGATPTPVATDTPTQSPTGSPTPKSSATPKPTATPTQAPTGAPTDTASPAPTDTPTSGPGPTATPTAAPTATSAPTVTPKPTATPKATATPTSAPTPTNAPTATPTAGPAGSFPGSQLPPGTLNPNVPPSGNFDMSIWSLQLPIGPSGSPTTITNTALQAGYTSAYFQTNTTSGTLDFFTPEANGCTTTANSKSCRSELREVTPAGLPAAWPDTGTNTLTATLVATKVAGDPKGVVVGQIHFASTISTLPAAELFYGSSGKLEVGIEPSATSSGETYTQVGTVAVGTKFTYVIDLSGNKLTVTVNNKATAIPIAYPANLQYYFKAGDYGQGTAPGDNVSFYGINVVHK